MANGYRKGKLETEVKRNIPGQLPLFQPNTVWSPPKISELPRWGDAKRVSIDVETNDKTLTTLGPGVRRGGYICGYCVAIEDGPSFYLPVRHAHGDNLDQQHVEQYMIDNAKVFTGDVVGANLAYDLDYLWEKSILFPKVHRYLDVQIAEPLIDEMQFRYNLETIAERHGLPGKDESVLREAAAAYYVDAKKGLWQLPGRFAVQYGKQDGELPLAILRRQERIIEERGLQSIWDLESRLTPVLVRMRRRGVLVDLKRLEWIEDWSLAEQKKLHKKIKEESGVALDLDDVNNAGAIYPVLKDHAKIGKCANGTWNIDDKLLKAMKNPLGEAIRRAKKFHKLRNTFAASVRRYLTNGRIHGSFKQLIGEGNSQDDEKGGRYGRLSMTDPNLQQQPSKDEEYDDKQEKNLLGPDDFHMGKVWRSIYIPEPGMKWAACDYSGQEPRMIVHYAAMARCTGADEMVAAYIENPDLDLHQKTATLAGIKRKPAKIIFLGVAYGMGEAKLCHGLNYPTKWEYVERMQKMIEKAGPEGKAFLNRYNEMVPFLIELRKKCEKQAGKNGFIKTILGRQLHFPKKKDGTEGYDWLHKALNRLVQGSAADQTKLACVIMDEQGMTPQLQVHDEIDDSVWDEADAERRAKIMRECVPLKVPTKVDVELGDSWGDSM